VPKDMTALPDAEVYHSFVPVLKGRRTAVTADGAKDPSDSETLYYAKHLFPQIAYPNEANIVWTHQETQFWGLQGHLRYCRQLRVSVQLPRNCVTRMQSMSS
jgi:hypothetical protein